MSMVTNQTIDVSGSMPVPTTGEVAGIRWYELRKSGANWTIDQEGTFALQPPDVAAENQLLHRWMGSAAMDKDGNIALGYSIVNDDDVNPVFPGIRYTGRRFDDPLGLMQDEKIIRSGTNSQTGGFGRRWGDYSALSVDPVDDCTFSYTTHVAGIGGTGPRPTQIASFRFDTCVPTGPVIIFDNFAPGNNYDCCVGWTLSEGNPLGTDLDQGDAFTPVGSNFILDRVELAVGLVVGPNELDVWLMSDDGGSPGEVIEAFHFSGAMGPFGSVHPPLVADSVLKPILTAGTQYWLIASTTGPDAWAAWNLNSIGDMGPHAFRENLGAWVVFGDTRGAFRITGMPVSGTGSAAGPQFSSISRPYVSGISMGLNLNERLVTSVPANK